MKPPCPAHRDADWRTALACLLHPCSLIALAVLGFNDHWWKGVGPGWLTGKLSDVAGLFFFPFLVVLASGLIAPRARAARSVFIAVGVWFAAAKSIPIVHAATVAVAELAVGSVHIARDPTDVVAVLALLPAWMLFRRLARAPRPSWPRALQPLVVSLAVLLTAATSKSPTYAVRDLVVHDGELYAGLVDDRYVPPDRHQAEVRRVFKTGDGIVWTEVEDPRLALFRIHTRQTELGNLRLASRAIEVNDGDTWRTEWTMPRTIRRLRDSASTQDIAAVPGDAGRVVVAFGTEGVLVRDRTGTWTRHAVGSIAPTPEATPETLRWRRTQLLPRAQWLFPLAAAFLTWVFLSALAWLTHRDSTVPTARAGREARPARLFLGPVRALRRLQWDTTSVSLAFIGLLLAATACVYLLQPVETSPSIATNVTLATVWILAASGVVTAVGWRRHLSRPGARRGTLAIPGALVIGALAFVLLRASQVEHLISPTGVGLLTVGAILAIAVWYAGSIGNQVD